VARGREGLGRPLPARVVLLVPHGAALLFVVVLAAGAAAVALVAVAVTGRYPRACWYVVEGTARWLLRAGAYLLLLTDAYPPFALYDVPSHPVRAGLEPPAGHRMARWRPPVAWLLVLPQTALLPLLYLGLFAADAVAAVSVLFGRGFPGSVFDASVRIMRFHCRVGAYALCMTPSYPGFRRRPRR
jgi:hypothetical protein